MRTSALAPDIKDTYVDDKKLVGGRNFMLLSMNMAVQH